MFTVDQIVQATGALRSHVEVVWPEVVAALKWQGIYDHYTHKSM